MEWERCPKLHWSPIIWLCQLILGSNLCVDIWIPLQVLSLATLLVNLLSGNSSMNYFNLIWNNALYANNLHEMVYIDAFHAFIECCTGEYVQCTNLKKLFTSWRILSDLVNKSNNLVAEYDKMRLPICEKWECYY